MTTLRLVAFWVLAALAGCAQPAFAQNDIARVKTPDLTCRYRVQSGPNKGKVVRSEPRKHLFWRESGYPNGGRAGYVVDHIVPLCAGGCDVPSNMAWMLAEEGQEKDIWERQYCAGRTDLTFRAWQAAAH